MSLSPLLILTFLMSALALGSSTGKPTFLLHLGQAITPGSPFPISVTLFEPEYTNIYMQGLPALIEAKLIFQGKVIELRQQECSFGSTAILNLTISPKLGNIANALTLEIDGNNFGGIKGSLFSKKIALDINKNQPHIVSLEASQDIYHQGETAHFRALIFDENHQPWHGSGDALLCNPNGDATERWTRMPTHNGVLQFSFPLTEGTTTGLWHVTISLSETSQSLPFYVLPGSKVRSGAVLKIRPSTLVISQDETLFGSASVTDHQTDQPLRGSLDLQAVFVQSHNLFQALKEDVLVDDIVLERKEFNEIGQLVWSLETNKVGPQTYQNTSTYLLLRGNFLDQSGRERTIGHALIQVVPHSLTLDFSTSSDVIYRDLPFELMFKVQRYDGSSFTSSEVDESDVTVSCLLSNGSEKKLETRYIGFHHDAHIWKATFLLKELDTDMATGAESITFLGVFGLVSRHWHKEKRLEVSISEEQDNFLAITTSSNQVQIGQNVIFHARSNKALGDLQFLLVSSSTGRIVVQRQISAGLSNIATFHEHFGDTEMIPGALAYLWQVNKRAQIVFAECFVSVQPQHERMEVELYPNITGDSIFVNIEAQDHLSLILQSQELNQDDLSSSPHPQRRHPSRLMSISDSKTLQLSSRTRSLELTSGGRSTAKAVVSAASAGLWKTLNLPKDQRIRMPGYEFQGLQGSDIVWSMFGVYRNGLIPFKTQLIRVQRPPKVTLELPPYCYQNDLVVAEVKVTNFASHPQSFKLEFEQSSMWRHVKVEQMHLHVEVEARAMATMRVPIKMLRQGVASIKAWIKVTGQLVSSNRVQVLAGNQPIHRRAIVLDLTSSQNFHVATLSPFCGSDNIPSDHLTASIRIGVGFSAGALIRKSWQKRQKQRNVIDTVAALKAALLQDKSTSQHHHQPIDMKVNGDDQLVKSLFQQVISFKDHSGFYFFTQSDRTPSTWLTIEALRVLTLCQSHSREIQYVDSMLIKSSLDWLLTQQRLTGSFRERPFHLPQYDFPPAFQELALTANAAIVLASLEEQQSHWNVTSSLKTATNFLVRRLVALDRKAKANDSDSMMTLALVARALQLSPFSKSAAETSFEILAKFRTERDGHMFWGEERDVLAIRATALALQVYGTRREFLSGQILTWITSAMATLDEDNTLEMASAFESVLTWQEHRPGVAENHHLISFSLHCPSCHHLQDLQLTDQSPVKELSVPIHQEVTLEAKGSGYGLILVSSSCHQPSTPASLAVEAKKSKLHKPSLAISAQVASVSLDRIHFSICTSWTNGLSLQAFSAPISLSFGSPPCFRLGKQPVDVDVMESRATGQVQLLLEKISAQQEICVDIELESFCIAFRKSTTMQVTVKDLLQPDIQSTCDIEHQEREDYFCAECIIAAASHGLVASEVTLLLACSTVVLLRYISPLLVLA